MKFEKLVGDRFKERSTDCTTDNHSLMIRGGYIKYVENGIFSSYTALRRVVRKIEQITREEMDVIDGQEVLFPVVLPASLWQESGRYIDVGNELVRFSDRNGKMHYPIMGCYGIGISRLAASVCEARHDEQGPIWPLTIAPWHVHLCCVRADDVRIKAFADKLYNQLQEEKKG